MSLSKISIFSVESILLVLASFFTVGISILTFGIEGYYEPVSVLLDYGALWYGYINILIVLNILVLFGRSILTFSKNLYPSHVTRQHLLVYIGLVSLFVLLTFIPTQATERFQFGDHIFEIPLGYNPRFYNQEYIDKMKEMRPQEPQKTLSGEGSFSLESYYPEFTPRVKQALFSNRSEQENSFWISVSLVKDMPAIQESFFTYPVHINSTSTRDLINSQIADAEQGQVLNFKEGNIEYIYVEADGDAGVSMSAWCFPTSLLKNCNIMFIVDDYFIIYYPNFTGNDIDFNSEWPILRDNLLIFIDSFKVGEITS